MGLGLKNYKKQYKGFSIREFKNVRYELKWAFQRFWRGYDDQYLFSLDDKLCELIPEILNWLLHNRAGSPVLDYSSEETCDEDWDNVLREILYHFKEAGDETCSEKNEYDMHGDLFGPAWRARNLEIETYKSDNLKRAFQMIAEYIGCFWD